MYMNAKVPDCDGWQQTLTQHARQLTAAGVDHAVIDMVRALGFRTWGSAAAALCLHGALGHGSS